MAEYEEVKGEKALIRQGYEHPGGQAWKAYTDRVINNEVIGGIYNQLVAFGYIPNLDEDFVFVSPSANTATHELKLFREDAENRKGKGTFVIGDISQLPIPSGRVNSRVSNSIFQYMQMDGDALPVADKSADMIWDRKGNIWHKAVSGSGERVLDALDRYHQKLKPGGVVVLDSIPDDNISRSGTSEQSTVTKINLLQDSNKVWSKIQEKYDVVPLGRGLTSVYVLQAK